MSITLLIPNNTPELSAAERQRFSEFIQRHVGALFPGEDVAVASHPIQNLMTNVDPPNPGFHRSANAALQGALDAWKAQGGAH